jgi:hypothetical protein
VVAGGGLRAFVAIVWFVNNGFDMGDGISPVDADDSTRYICDAKPSRTLLMHIWNEGLQVLAVYEQVLGGCCQFA